MILFNNSTSIFLKWFEDGTREFVVKLILSNHITYIQVRFACLRCADGGHFVSAGGSLRSPGVTLVNYKGDNISKYVHLSVKIDFTRKITKFVNF